MSQLYIDAKRRPEAFRWNGPLSPQDIRAWQTTTGFAPPQDLLELWIRTGGGELFESEKVLSPFGDATVGLNVTARTDDLHKEGLAKSRLVFHEGLGLSAIRLTDNKYEHLMRIYEQDDRSLRVIGFSTHDVFENLDEWYTRLLRQEY